MQQSQAELLSLRSVSGNTPVNCCNVPRKYAPWEQLLIRHLAGLSLAILATLSTAASPQPLDHMPSPELDPSAVVRIQVEALRNNSQLNEGIVLTYNFASPANKGFTGPLNRFIAMLNSASYKQLLNHRSARYGPVVVSDREARQIVIITDMEGELISAYQWGARAPERGQVQ